MKATPKSLGIAGLILGLGAAGPASAIEAGSAVAVSFTCRMTDGTVAASTEPSWSQEGVKGLAPIFLKPAKPGPVTLTAGATVRLNPEAGFEEAVQAYLAAELPAAPLGQPWTVTIEDPPRSAGGQVIKLARVRKRPKEERMTADEYNRRTGKTPAVGASHTIDPAVPGTITAVGQDGQVTIVYTAAPGTPLTTPFGPAVIRDGGQTWEIVIDAQPGRLVRVGPLVGRITETAEETFTADFSQPLAGEALTCEVTAQPERKANSE
ncbi:MAG: hypothetical protein AB1634_09335 [Thermodesulfobacteriota bacterium]